MPFIFEVREELKEGRAIPRKQPRLDFVSPHFVVECGNTAHGKEGKCHTEGVTRVISLGAVIFRFQFSVPDGFFSCYSCPIKVYS